MNEGDTDLPSLDQFVFVATDRNLWKFGVDAYNHRHINCNGCIHCQDGVIPWAWFVDWDPPVDDSGLIRCNSDDNCDGCVSEVPE